MALQLGHLIEQSVAFVVRGGQLGLERRGQVDGVREMVVIDARHIVLKMVNSNSIFLLKKKENGRSRKKSPKVYVANSIIV